MNKWHSINIHELTGLTVTYIGITDRLLIIVGGPPGSAYLACDLSYMCTGSTGSEG